MNDRQQDIEAIVRGWNDRQPGESDEDVAGRIVDDLARTNTERLEDDRADAELWRAAIRRGARDLAETGASRSTGMVLDPETDFDAITDDFLGLSWIAAQPRSSPESEPLFTGDEPSSATVPITVLGKYTEAVADLLNHIEGEGYERSVAGDDVDRLEAIHRRIIDEYDPIAAHPDGYSEPPEPLSSAPEPVVSPPHGDHPNDSYTYAGCPGCHPEMSEARLRIVIEGSRGTVVVEPVPNGPEVTAECAAMAASVLLGYRPSRFRLAHKASGVMLDPAEPPHNGTWVLVEVGDVGYSEPPEPQHPDDGHKHWYACVRCSVDNGLNESEERDREAADLFSRAPTNPRPTTPPPAPPAPPPCDHTLRYCACAFRGASPQPEATETP